jgi:hypothetical protein
MHYMHYMPLNPRTYALHATHTYVLANATYALNATDTHVQANATYALNATDTHVLANLKHTARQPTWRCNCKTNEQHRNLHNMNMINLIMALWRLLHWLTQSGVPLYNAWWIQIAIHTNTTYNSRDWHARKPHGLRALHVGTVIQRIDI